MTGTPSAVDGTRPPSRDALEWLQAAAVDPAVLELRPDYGAFLVVAEDLQPGPTDAASDALLRDAEVRACRLLAGRAPIGGEDLDRYSGPARLVCAAGTEAFDTTSSGDPTVEHPEKGRWCGATKSVSPAAAGTGGRASEPGSLTAPVMRCSSSTASPSPAPTA